MSERKYPSVPCPKCNRMLAPSGEVNDGESLLPVYSCDECLMNVDFSGNKMEIALTFAMRDGEPFDPADPEGKLPF